MKLFFRQNFYKTQKNPGKSLHLNNAEFEQIIGTLSVMFIVNLSSTRWYWNFRLNFLLVSLAISRDRFKEIKPESTLQQ